MPALREWTILLYMAGDNGKTFQTKQGTYSLMAEMTTPGFKDISEVEKIGTTDQIAILAQFDTLPSKDSLAQELGTEQGGSYRLEILKGRSAKENIVEVIPEVNTGAPAELAKFIVWGMTRCPAQRTMLVLWNHGLGWKDEDIYQTVRSMSRSALARRAAREVNTAMFRTSAPQIARRAEQTSDRAKRAILCDDSSMDFLTNVEMAQALRVAEFAVDETDVVSIFGDEERLQAVMKRGTEGGLRHLNVIGMDACLMAMIEVQYQVRKFADVMVASQEVEPMQGWPYTAILAELDRRPTMSPAELGALIVDKFAESYVSATRRPPNVTQSAIDLSKMGEAALLIRGFARALAKDYHADLYIKEAYRDAREFAGEQHYAFDFPEYVDLVSFLKAILEGYRGTGPEPRSLQTGQRLLDWLLSAESPILKNAVTGDFKDKAYGISIYVPDNQPSPLYKDLDFRRAGWLQALETINKKPVR